VSLVQEPRNPNCQVDDLGPVLRSHIGGSCIILPITLLREIVWFLSRRFLAYITRAFFFFPMELRQVRFCVLLASWKLQHIA